MNCGMSDLVGPIYIESGKGSKVSLETERNVDMEVRRLLKEAYQRVTTLLVRSNAV